MESDGKEALFGEALSRTFRRHTFGREAIPFSTLPFSTYSE
jgi:hypothetical protein